jgi:hypothetical protein
MESYELTLPTWMASTLINGDISGITDKEESQIDDLLSYINDHNLGYCVDVSEKSSFYYSPPLDSILSYGEALGGDYSIYTFLYNG